MYYYWGKDPTFAFGTAVPFGLNYRQMNAWFYHGGGNQLIDEFLADYNCVVLPAGNTGVPRWAAGSVARSEPSATSRASSSGSAASPAWFSRSSASCPSRFPGGEIYAALEKGTIDAAEWVGPYDDEKLGLAKVAKFYYTPGWWEGGAALHTFVGQKALDSLPPEYRAALECATAEATVYLMAKYDAINPGAMRSLLAGGAQLRAFSKPVMDACYKATQEVYAETAAKNADFKKMHDAYMAFRGDQYQWWRVAELNYDLFMVRQRL
jgi:TRAP-type mannitol/chloroaromatic compound transport system substrate-binding protein